MEDSIINLFEEGIELENRKKINSLMDDWRNEVAPNMIKFKDDNKYYSCDKYFTADGFFPGYYKQKNKLLLIARETRDMSGRDYIAEYIDSYKNDNGHNKNLFTRRISYIVLGVKTEGKRKFENLEEANDYAKEMAEENDYGYAMMNISKYSNDSETGDKADVELMNNFLEHSNLQKRNFFKEELVILQPDIIITANLWDGKIGEDYLELFFGKLKEKKRIEGKAVLSEMELNNKKIKLIDMYHFSSHMGKDKDYYYDPIMELLFG